MTFDGLIVAAGSQKRFNGKMPKALVPYNNSSLLEHNIKIMKNYCKKIHVLCSVNDFDLFEKYIEKNVSIIAIKSGLGCGDAILKGLEYIKGNNIITIWGDSIQIDKNIYSKCINYYSLSPIDFLMPVKYENKPYVQIKIDDNENIDSVIFSKITPDLITSGYHDLSFFVFNKNKIKKVLNKIKDIYFNNDKNSYEMRENSNEFSFLDIFNFYKKCNYKKINSCILIFENINGNNSFNTIEEYSEIIDKNEI